MLGSTPPQAPSVPFNDLRRAASEQAEKLTQAALRVIESGWFVQGSEHRRFEEGFARYLGVEHVMGVASGTDALELAMRAVTTSARRTIVTVANAGAYTTCAALAAGLDVAFADIDPEDHLISAGSLNHLLNERVCAVVVTHLYGRLADTAAVRLLCEPLGIAVIEDCAQSTGAHQRGTMGGAAGHLATFSFYPTKNLGALGDGGAVATSDPALAERVRQLRQYGWTRKYTNAIPGGRNSRLDEIQAAFLNRRLPLLAKGNERRRAIISRYADAAPAGVRVLPADGPHHAGHLAVVETDSATHLAGHLRSYGVATEVHYPVPDHKQPFITTDIALPVTESKVGRILSLPCFPELADDEVAQVCEALSHYQCKE